MTNLPPPTSHFLADSGNDAMDERVGSRRWIAISVVGAVALLAGIALWIAHARGTSIHYITAPVTRGPLTVAVTATGTLQPINQVEIGSELSGTIKSVMVDYNDVVKVGKELARIDTTRLEARPSRGHAS